MAKPLRILSIVNLPLDPRLGAARVYVELVKHWKAAGHEVGTFCLTDAFPKRSKSNSVSILRQVIFPYRAAQYVRRNASRFDVIDALIGTLPFSKSSLRFNGLVVARSVGFPRAYEKFDRLSRKRWPAQPRGKLIGRAFHNFVSRLSARNSERALRHCDLINLLNEDEIEFLNEPSPIRKPFIVQPNGLSDTERADLEHRMEPAQIRLQRQEICFIGMWGIRKGARDWPHIIRRVREKVPAAQFNLLGTMTDEKSVLSALGDVAGAVRVVSIFEREKLPALLEPCAVGLFPSYVEGFGLAVLEQLACGIPTVAYDVAGPRQILQSARTALLVPEGDASALADRAVEILRMKTPEYSALCAQCRDIARQFRWEKIAADTAREYQSALENSAIQQ